jgi:hypothetical protein
LALLDPLSALGQTVFFDSFIFMKLLTFIFVSLSLIGGLGSSALAEKIASKKEKRFVSLFNGSSTDQWMNAKSGEFPDKGWIIEDNCLKHVAKGGGGDIITRNKYEEFDFRFEWKVAKGANSGVKYFIIRDRGSLGHEYQVLDDVNHPDGAKGANRQTAAFYDVLDPAKDKPLKPVGEFNSSRILVKGNTVKHFLNGKTVLTYKLGSEDLKAAIAKSKFKNLKVFGQRLSGHILLQDHGDAVWYRNIRIRDLGKK